VLNQQATYFEAQDDDRCPRQAFTEDLLTEVAKWKLEGDQIVIGMDANDDVRYSNFATLMRRADFYEVVTDKHGQSGPSTYARGTKPVDAIWVLSSLRHSECGYLPFGSFDHRPLFIDLPSHLVFGSSALPAVRPQAQRLQLEDPRIVQRYQDRLRTRIRQHRLISRAAVLYAGKTSPPTEAQVAEYNAIDKVREEAMKEADKRCRKLRMGAVPFTPEYQAVTLTIRLWSLVRKQQISGKVDSRYLKRISTRANIPNPLRYTKDEVRQRLDAAYREKRKITKEAENR
jgi:hypothetical protein